MTVLIKRIFRWTAATVLMLMGLVLTIPGVPGPGLLIVLIGVLLLLPESRWLRKRYARFKRRYPLVFSPIERYRQRWRAERRTSRGRATR